MTGLLSNDDQRPIDFSKIIRIVFVGVDPCVCPGRAQAELPQFATEANRSIWPIQRRAITKTTNQVFYLDDADRSEMASWRVAKHFAKNKAVAIKREGEIVLWNTLYMNKTVEYLKTTNMEVRDEDLRRITPLRFKHIRFLGRYDFTLRARPEVGGLRPLRQKRKM